MLEASKSHFELNEHQLFQHKRILKPKTSFSFLDQFFFSKLVEIFESLAQKGSEKILHRPFN